MVCCVIQTFVAIDFAVALSGFARTNVRHATCAERRRQQEELDLRADHCCEHVRTTNFPSTLPSVVFGVDTKLISRRDTTGTFAMATALAAFKVLTAVHKHYTVEDWVAFDKTASNETMAHVCVSMGTSDDDLAKVTKILELVNRVSPSVQFRHMPYFELSVFALSPLSL